MVLLKMAFLKMSFPEMAFLRREFSECFKNFIQAEGLICAQTLSANAPYETVFVERC